LLDAIFVNSEVVLRKRSDGASAWIDYADIQLHERSLRSHDIIRLLPTRWRSWAAQQQEQKKKTGKKITLLPGGVTKI
jgi:hypothetical protein